MHKVWRLMVLLLACGVLIAPVRAQTPTSTPAAPVQPGPTEDFGQLLSTPGDVTPLGVVGTVLVTLAGLVVWILRALPDMIKRLVDSREKDRESERANERDKLLAEIAALKMQTESQHLQAEMTRELLTLYSRNADAVQDMVKEMGQFGGRLDQQSKLYSSQSAVLLTVGKDVEAQGTALETVREIVLGVLDEEKTQTQHGLTVIQMLEDIGSNLAAILDKLRTKDLSQTRTAVALAAHDAVIELGAPAAPLSASES